MDNIKVDRIKRYISETKAAIEANLDSKEPEVIANREILRAVVSDLEFILKNKEEDQNNANTYRKRRYFYDSFGDGKLYEFFPKTNSISRDPAVYSEYFLELMKGSDQGDRIWFETDRKRFPDERS